jgi:hypothetical protein
MENNRGALKGVFHSKLTKVVFVLLIALLIGAASSTVYVFYIANVTATVKTPDMVLRPGTDSSACTTSYPCATVTPAATHDFETISFSLFPSAINTPQPATYYSNLTTIQNHGTVSHDIDSIQLSTFTGVASLGSITVYFCTTQTEFNPSGTLVTPANCVGSSAVTSSSSSVQTVSGSFPVTLTAGSKGYIEVAAYALSTATAGQTITFTIAFQWI